MPPKTNLSHIYDNNYEPSSSSSRSAVLPLSISRPRPMTPNSASPLRPTRSSMRPRQTSQYSLDSTDVQQSDVQVNNIVPRTNSRKSSEDNDISPVAKSAIVGFQQAGARKRALTNQASERDKDRDREFQEEKRRQKRIQGKAPGREGKRGLQAMGDIDAVLDQVKDDWAFVADADFSPVDLALRLIADSSNGDDFNNFWSTEVMLSRSLKNSVDQYFHAFASAVPHHSTLQSRFGSVQDDMKGLKVILQEAKDSLGNRRSDLVQLWSRNQILEEMMKLLDQIDHLKSVPDTLESLIAEKRLHQASTLLVQSLRQINSQEMQDIGAMSDLRVYLSSQENAIKEILIDELHNHLYLKLPQFEPDHISWPPTEAHTNSPLNSFLLNLSTRPRDFSYDFGRTNNEYDLSIRRASTGAGIPQETRLIESRAVTVKESSFIYMEMLLESLTVLGKLGDGLDIISQRLPGEIHSLIDATIEEVSEQLRNNHSDLNSSAKVKNQWFTFNASRASTKLDRRSLSKRSQSNALQPPKDRFEVELLQELFDALYFKLDSVIQGVRVIYEVANRIGQRRDFKDSSGSKSTISLPLNEIWFSIQTEVRNLLNDYLVDQHNDDNVTHDPSISIEAILRAGKYTRDRTKQLYRMGDASSKATSKPLREYEEELTRILKETVPGLVQGSTDVTVQTTSSFNSNDERSNGSGRHRLLTEPNAFHVQILFKPTVTFLNRVAEELPLGMEFARTFATILEEFFSSVYFPQLEEKASLAFDQIVNERDAFQVDTSSISEGPLITAVIQLIALVNSLCAMIRAAPLHRDNYARVILGLVIRFYQRCSDQLQKVVVSATSGGLRDQPVISVRWAQREDLGLCLSQLKELINKDRNNKSLLCKQESDIELGLLGESSISKEDLVDPISQILTLSGLYQSLEWLVHRLDSLKVVASDEVVSDALYPFSISPDIPDNISTLPLSSEMALRFDSLLKTYGQLTQLILYVIRIDMRCRSIYAIDLAMRHGNYQIEQEDSEPDRHIVNLCTELEKYDAYLQQTLKNTERLFVLEGLESLMEQLLISGSLHIRLMNGNGIRKMMRNISALRQTLAAVMDIEDCQFRRARHFYNLFYLGPEKLLESIKVQRTYTFDEYRALIGLQCGIGRNVAGTNHGDKQYSMYIIELHGIELDSTGDK